MNVDVLHRLGEAVAQRGPGAYILTVSSDGPAPDPNSSCAADCLPLLDTAAPIPIAPPR